MATSKKSGINQPTLTAEELSLIARHNHTKAQKAQQNGGTMLELAAAVDAGKRATKFDAVLKARFPDYGVATPRGEGGSQPSTPAAN